jgi:hypothetical protein
MFTFHTLPKLLQIMTQNSETYATEMSHTDNKHRLDNEICTKPIKKQQIPQN